MGLYRPIYRKTLRRCYRVYGNGCVSSIGSDTASPGSWVEREGFFFACRVVLFIMTFSYMSLFVWILGCGINSFQGWRDVFLKVVFGGSS